MLLPNAKFSAVLFAQGSRHAPRHARLLHEGPLSRDTILSVISRGFLRTPQLGLAVSADPLDYTNFMPDRRVRPACESVEALALGG
jgi:hypothetical protein